MLNIENYMSYNAKTLSLDAAENIFFKRELETILPDIVNVEHALINARKVFPISTAVDPTSDIYTFRQFRKTGNSEFMSDKSTSPPLVNVFGEEFTSNVRTMWIAAEWSLKEIRAAAKVNRPLDRMQTDAARESLLRQENGLIFAGDVTHGLIGLFSDPNIVEVTVAGGTWATGPKAPVDILFDMNDCVNKIVETTGDVEVPDTLLLPTPQFNQIATTQFAAGTDTTILEYFIRNQPYVKNVTNIRELTGAGAGSSDVMVAYKRDPSKLRMHVPMDVQQEAPQQHNLSINVIYTLMTGGLEVLKPGSIRLCNGI